MGDLSPYYMIRLKKKVSAFKSLKFKTPVSRIKTLTRQNWWGLRIHPEHSRIHLKILQCKAGDDFKTWSLNVPHAGLFSVSCWLTDTRDFLLDMWSLNNSFVVFNSFRSNKEIDRFFFLLAIIYYCILVHFSNQSESATCKRSKSGFNWVDIWIFKFEFQFKEYGNYEIMYVYKANSITPRIDGFDDNCT